MGDKPESGKGASMKQPKDIWNEFLDALQNAFTGPPPNDDEMKATLKLSEKNIAKMHKDIALMEQRIEKTKKHAEGLKAVAYKANANERYHIQMTVGEIEADVERWERELHTAKQDRDMVLPLIELLSGGIDEPEGGTGSSSASSSK